MPVQHERRVRLPPHARSPGHARRVLRAVLADAHVPDELGDTAVLLASELCENAVLHAGTDFEVAVDVDDEAVTVTVSDHGPGPLELHLAQPRRRYGRAATHGRGLAMLARLATAWGTRHESDGMHRVWFSLARLPPGPDVAASAAPAAPAPDTVLPAGSPELVRRLLHLPPGLSARLDAAEIVAELVRRLREVLGATSVAVDLDDGGGSGLRELARDGPRPAAGTWDVPLPTTAPLRGVLRVHPGPGHPDVPGNGQLDLAALVAQRAGMAVESEWLRGADERRRAWMTYLAETSELLGQSLDVELSVAVIPQVVVPRLGQWCAVHLVDGAGRLLLGALTHAEEERIPELRAALEPGAPGDLHRRLARLARGRAGGRTRFTVPTDGVAVPLTTRGRVIGTLSVGRPAGRPHSPEDAVLIGDVARRAALAVHNAQTTAAHVGVSQALQQALLPRALPLAPGVEFAAEYLPATTGTEVGGDFYDVHTLSPTQWLLSIGDVCGTGARAAARTGLVRDVLRVLVRDGRPLPRAVALLNDVMMDAADPLQYGTLAAATLRRPGPRAPDGLDVELVLAGHLQPIVLRADGRTGFVGRFGTAVGLLPRVEVTATRHHLDPGDVLLLYTDGVTERRRDRELFGPDRLLEVVAGAAGRGAAGVVGAVRAAVLDWSAEPGDDVALLAVRAGTAP